jgi:hypothetical protein
VDEQGRTAHQRVQIVLGQVARELDSGCAQPLALARVAARDHEPVWKAVLAEGTEGLHEPGEVLLPAQVSDGEDVGARRRLGRPDAKRRRLADHAHLVLVHRVPAHDVVPCELGHADDPLRRLDGSAGERPVLPAGRPCEVLRVLLPGEVVDRHHAGARTLQRQEAVGRVHQRGPLAAEDSRQHDLLPAELRSRPARLQREEVEVAAALERRQQVARVPPPPARLGRDGVTSVEDDPLHASV